MQRSPLLLVRRLLLPPALLLVALPGALQADLIGLYTFDDPADPLRDDSGQGAALVGAGADPVYQSAGGIEGGSYQFDGTQRLTVPLDINPGARPQLTVGAWVRTDSLAAGERKILGHDNGGWDRTIGLDNRQPDGEFRYMSFVGNGPPVSGTPAPQSTEDWTFIAVTYDQPNSELTVYVDLDSTTTGDPLQAVSSPAEFGTGFATVSLGSIRPDNPSEGWVGNIDNVFFYDELLSAEEVAAIRDGGSTRLRTPFPKPAPREALLAFYPFDDGGDPSADAGGAGRDLVSGGADPAYAAAGGFEDGGYTFDGTQRWIAPIDVGPAAQPQLTMGAWVKTASVAPGLRKILGHDDGGWDRTIGLDDREGPFRYTSFVGNGPPAVGGPAPTSTDAWTFIAAVYDQPGNTMTLYVDLDAASVEDPFAVVRSATGFGAGFNTVAIGGIRPDNNAEGWLGDIDNVFFYGAALSAGQIAGLRDGGRAAVLSRDDPNVEVARDSVLDRLGQITEPAPFAIPVMNGGAAQMLLLGPPVVSGPDAARYSITSAPASIAPGATGEIAGVFDPGGRTGRFEATLTLQSNDPGDPVVEIDLGAVVSRGRDGLIAFYSFDDPGNPLRDDSDSDRWLASAGANPVYGAGGGSQGGAFTFDGTQRLVIPLDMNPGSLPELTLGAWVKPSSLASGLRKVIGHDDGGWDRTIGLDNRQPDGEFRYSAFVGNGPPVAGTPAPASTETWAFLAVTYDQPNNQVTVYVDNDPASSEALAGVSAPTGMGTGLSTASLGSLRPDNAAEGWEGGIDNVFFFDRILSAEELGEVRSGGKSALLGEAGGPPLDALFAYYPFDDPGDPLADASGKGNTLQDGADGGAANPTYVADEGLTGGAFSFNGTQRLIAPLDINPDQVPELTLGAWVKTATLNPGLRKIMGHDDGGWDRTIGLDDREGPFRYSAFVGNRRPLVGTPGPNDTDDWTFIAVTYDNPRNEVTVYLDLNAESTGDPLVSASEPTEMGFGQAGVSIGSLRPDNAAEGWEGSIDNVFFFDTVLNRDQITYLRDNRGPFPPPATDPDLRITGVPDLENLGRVPPVHTLSFAVRNEGAAQTLNIGPVTVRGPDAGYFTVQTPSLNLPPGASGTIDVLFDPAGQVGRFSAELVIPSNDAAEPEVTADLSARVAADASLLGFYPFDDAGDPLADASGNGLPLTDGADGGAADPVYQAASGFEGGAFSFDGVQRLVAPIDINPGSVPQVTLGAWVKTATLDSGLRKVMGHDDGGWDRTIGLDNRQPDGEFRYSAFTGSGPPVAGTPAPVSTDDWTFLAAVYDQPGGEVTVYVDLDASSTADAPAAVSTAASAGNGFPTVAIGGIRPDNANEGWQGLIDNAFLLRGALDADAVRAVRDGGRDALFAFTADPILTTSADPVFGEVDGGPVTRMVPVSNSGVTQTLSIDRVTVTGPDASLYTVGAFPASLEPGSAGAIEVTFDPAGAEGSFDAELEIVSNDSGNRFRLLDLAARVAISNPVNALIGFYSFDDPADPLRDDSGKGNGLSQVAGAEPVYDAASGHEGGAFEFDGSQRLIAPIDINPDVLPTVTLGAWVKTSSLDPGLRKAIGHDNGAWDRVIGLDERAEAAGGPLPAGTLRYMAFPGTNNFGPTQGDPPPTPLSTEAWTFLAAAYDQPNNQLTLYVDLDASSTDDPMLRVESATAMGRGFSTTSIGSLRPDNAAEGWVGFIDNAFFYEAILDEEQLNEIREGGADTILGGGDDPNLRLPRDLVFGDVGPGGSTRTRTVTLRNTGSTQTLMITGTELRGPDAARYAVVSAPEALAPGASGDLVLRFDPQAGSGGFVAFLDIASNDSGDPVVSLDLSARVSNGNGLLVHYPMDETEGEQMLDFSGLGRHGVYKTAAPGAVTLGQPALASGNAVALDDGGDAGAGFAEIPAAAGLPLLGNFSASLWVNQDAGDPGVSSLFAKGRTAGDPFALVTFGGGLVWFSGETQGLELADVITPGAAQHIVATYEDAGDSGTVTLYIDGAEAGRQGGVAPVADTAGALLQIGAIGGGFGLTGVVDDFQLYEGILAADKVAYLFQHPGEELPGLPPGGDVDTDGDGATDAAEAIAGTDPLDPASVFRAEEVTRDENGFTIRWQSVPEKTYFVEFSPTMTGDWDRIATVASESDSTSYLDDDAGRLGMAAGFYRAVVSGGDGG